MWELDNVYAQSIIFLIKEFSLSKLKRTTRIQIARICNPCPQKWDTRHFRKKAGQAERARIANPRYRYVCLLLKNLYI